VRPPKIRLEMNPERTAKEEKKVRPIFMKIETVNSEEKKEPLMEINFHKESRG
jgi:hypothetical protein